MSGLRELSGRHRQNRHWFSPEMYIATLLTLQQTSLPRPVNACECLLTLRDPGLQLVPTWGIDVQDTPAVDAHEGTEEHIREAHCDRHTVDCGNAGLFPDHDILRTLAGGASPLRSNGFNKGQRNHHVSLPLLLILTLWAMLAQCEGWGLLRMLPWQRGWSS